MSNSNSTGGGGHFLLQKSKSYHCQLSTYSVLCEQLVITDIQVDTSAKLQSLPATDTDLNRTTKAD